MDDFREWLSDNLRYILLGAAVLIILLVLFFGIRACSGLMKGNSGKEQGVETENSQGNGPSSPTTGGETTDEKNESTNPMEKDAYPAVNALIKDYYQALGEKDIETLRTLVDELSPADESRITNAKEYLEGYQVKAVYTKKGIKEGDYLVYAYYDYICKGVSTPVPALSQLYVRTDSNGDLKIFRNTDADEEINAYIEEIMAQKDVQDLKEQVYQENKAAQESDESLRQFLEGLGNDAGADTGESEQKTTLTANTECYVRAEASGESTIIGYLSTGDQVEKTGEDGEWIQIAYEGMTGYVHQDLLD